MFMLGLFLLIGANQSKLMAQAVTNAQIFGQVLDDQGSALVAASVQAKHIPSGTLYGVYTREDGRYNIPSLRVGGPYTITISYIGYKTVVEENIYLSLGQNLRYNTNLVTEAVSLDEVIISANTNEILNSQRTGAATNIKKEALAALPTLSRSINDFIRLTPQSRASSVATTTGSGTSFMGQDSRYNNLSLDGSIFNNSFGLASAPGGQANSTPIGLDAIEEIQVNLAPFDVRQGGFTGAGINAVTKSGSNNVEGTAYFNTRNQNLVGNKASGRDVTVLNFDIKQFGVSLGAPIIKDKLFIFVNAEAERREDPLQYRALQPGETSGGNITRVRITALDSLRTFLINNFDYDPGAYDGYTLPTYSDKALVKLDYNLNSKNKLSFRYNYLKSYRDVLASGSGAAGFRNGNLNALNFSSANYRINNNIHSAIIELNSIIGSRMSNQIQFGFTANRDFRSSPSPRPFPLVDIREGGNTFTSFGYEAFTPNNVLNTNTIQFQDNLTWYLGNHNLTAGVNFESFSFENAFTPRYYGNWTYASLADFYSAAAGDSVSAPIYEIQYSVLPNREVPVDKITIYQPGVYVQDQFSTLKDRLTLTLGVRVDVPLYSSDAAFLNQRVADVDFRDADGSNIRIRTDELPETQFMFSPRLGFNYDVKGDRSLQIRGGLGVFTGRVPFVWLSNQIGNNGVTKNTIREVNAGTRKYLFTDDIDAYIPENPGLAPSFNIAATDKNFKFPQVFRANLAIDYKLPFEIVASLEGIYNKTLNNIYYIDANQKGPIAKYEGADQRDIYSGGNANRINSFVTDAMLLKNTKEGYSFSITPKLERQFKNDLYIMLAYNFSEAKDLLTGGSIANSSWADNFSYAGNNYPDLAFSNDDQRHRFISAVSYKFKYSKYASTQVSLFYQYFNQGRFTLTVNGDINQDGVTRNNDLLYIPKDGSELEFKDIANGPTAQEQRDAFMKFVNDNPEIEKFKGTFFERNGGLLPFISGLDLSIIQEFKIKTGKKNHTLQLRADIYNLLNLISSDLGGGNQVIVNTTPLKFEGKSADNKPIYTFAKDNNGQFRTDLFQKTAGLADIYQMQLGVRYLFN
ncbi:MAG: TonB-dependent receptor [Saprospiraceae bacterium]|nr:TonB-dependent receptor [Saprospiraceae bacterium]